MNVGIFQQQILVAQSFIACKAPPIDQVHSMIPQLHLRIPCRKQRPKKVEVPYAFWIHTSRSNDHSTPRSFLLVATTTSMRQSLSSNASITLSVSQLQLSITPFPCFSFHSFLLSGSSASIYSQLQATNTIKRYSKGF